MEVLSNPAYPVDVTGVRESMRRVPYFLVKEAAEFMRVSEPTIRWMLAKGLLAR
jgi:hypothetical protein